MGFWNYLHCFTIVLTLSPAVLGFPFNYTNALTNAAMEPSSNIRPRFDNYVDPDTVTSDIASVKKADAGDIEFTPTDPQLPEVYQASDSIDAGYAYEYLSPDNFDLQLATVTNGVLAAAGPAYQAMVIRGNDSLTVFGLEKLVEYAQQGLPIIFCGGLPSTLASYNESGF
ncbi:hypothetical protein BP5796_11530 [Coleophoma crateriformis]|uniref:Glycoside hydrolase family 3 C-terminal domain-containing protein n=1 Tax=Coleophoma crateriformis TaxID=565419 RepID=A0A3D8QIU8_9HELO|nr:hypothetical protein BP5796_11530 [Coleophoma crateriformis]